MSKKYRNKETGEIVAPESGHIFEPKEDDFGGEVMKTTSFEISKKLAR